MEYQKRSFARSNKTKDHSNKSLSKLSKHQPPDGCVTNANKINQNVTEKAPKGYLPPFEYILAGYNKSVDHMETRPTVLADGNQKTYKDFEFTQTISEYTSKKSMLGEPFTHSQLKTKFKSAMSTPVSPLQGSTRKTQDVKNLETPKHLTSKVYPNNPKKIMKRQTEIHRKGDEKEFKLYGHRTEIPERRNLTEETENYLERSDSRVLEVTLKTPDSRSSSPVLQTQNMARRKKRSEIPLRKNRTDVSRGESQIPMLSKEPLEEIESATSVLLDDEFLGLFSNLQVYTDYASNQINTKEMVENMTSDSPEEEWKAERLLELDTVRSSSFTVLSRLETFHKKNIDSKENSVKSLTKKSPKKIPDIQTDSKELKMKTKYPKKQGAPGKKSPQKLEKTAKSKLENDKEVVESEKITSVTSDTEKNKTHPKEDMKVTSNGPQRRENLSKTKSWRSVRKLSSPAGIQKQKEEAENPENQGITTPKTPRTPLNSGRSSIHSLESSKNEEEKEIASFHIDSNMLPIVNQQFVVSNKQTEEVLQVITNSDEKPEDSESLLTLPNNIESANTKMETLISSSKENINCTKSNTELKDSPLILSKDEPPEKPKDSMKAVDKAHVKIDLRITGDAFKCETDEANLKCNSSPDMLPTNAEEEKIVENLCLNDSNLSENEEKNKKDDLVSTQMRPKSPTFPKTRKSVSSLKGKPQHKFRLNTKTVRKKKRCDADDKGEKLTTVLLDSHQNKLSPDAKLRSGFTKPSNKDEARDIFEDAAFMKLKRRNSEPNSFRGFVWKCSDCPIPRDNKASVSSMTSSLRHLNTDEIDDFIFWEAIPQRMTSCWERSLYNSKRPWSLLSCSVFKDNRRSSTPGSILDNLRNGGAVTARQPAITDNDKMTYCGQNPFDVEPSIAQKNIDIRNWLAALNFPTAPSTSAEVVTEGNFTSQPPVDIQKLNKTILRRKKVLSNSYEQNSKKRIEAKEKHGRISKWSKHDTEGLTELIRRKSGGFVTKKSFLNNPIHRPNVTVNLCVYSESVKEPTVIKPENRNDNCKPKKYKSMEVTPQPEFSQSATVISAPEHLGGQPVDKKKPKERQERARGRGECDMGAFIKNELNRFLSDVTFWKFLFIITLSMIIIHYLFLDNITA